MNIEYSPESCTAQVGSKFQVYGPGLITPVDLQLLTVTEHARDSNLQAYSLLLSGPADVCLDQGIYTLQHEQLADAELFLSPVGTDADGFLYEIVFNQLLDAGATVTGVARETSYE